METDAPAERVRLAYEAVHAPLWRAVLAYSGSADVADEAVAEAFAQLLRRGDGVDDPAAWAWRSAFRIAAGELQQRRLVRRPATRCPTWGCRSRSRPSTSSPPCAT